MSTGSDYPFLVPDPDFETEPFWTAVRNHEFKLQQCGPCSQYRWPPQQVCPYCQSEDHEWQTLSGKATLYTYIIITQPVSPSGGRSHPTTWCRWPRTGPQRPHGLQRG